MLVKTPLLCITVAKTQQQRFGAVVCRGHAYCLGRDTVCACVVSTHSYVVNYDFPRTVAQYVQRVGRTGR